MPNPLYLYCLTYSNQITNLPQTAIDESFPLLTIKENNIAAVISQVLFNDFVGSAAETQLQDVQWVAPRVYRHETVIQEIQKQSPLLPARFGTLFSSEIQLREFLQTETKTIIEFLEKVAQREEWGVKGFMDRTKALNAFTQKALTEQEETLRRLSTGARYFQERQIQKEAEKELNQVLKEILTQIVNNLVPLSHDSCERQVLSRKATGRVENMVSNWAFLIDTNQLAAFQAQVATINQKHQQIGLTLDLSGPWPPYSFCPSFTLNK